MDNKKQEEEDDLLAMLEDTQKDFVKKLSLNENQKEEVKEGKPDIISQLEEARIKDEQLSKNSESEAEGKQSTENPLANCEDFFKGFEEFTKNLGPGFMNNMQISPDEMAKASEMFKDMFKEHSDAQNDEDDEDDQADPSQPQDNPFLAGYQNLSNDAKKMGNTGGVPDLGNMNAMFQDEEFKQFFNQFTQGLFTEGGAGMPFPGEMPNMSNENMMENLMKEFTGFLEENKENPELKTTFDKMMNDIISKESMYPPMKLMKEELPKYLEENCEKLDPKDLERYNNQLDIVEEICKKFESNDENSQESIIDSLEKLQQYGSPPPELIKKIQSESSHFPGLGGMPGFGGMGFK